MASPDADAPARKVWRWWPRRQAGATSPSRITAGDVVLVLGGINLGLICAVFPWYVFFNQEQFGIRAMKFNDIPSTGPLPTGATPAGRIDAPMPAAQTDTPALDDMSTGTVTSGKDERPAPPGVAEQPFPEPAADYEVVHIANGRAMLQDATGLWLVQRGSLLPDRSHVAAIEKRGDAWVIVTSDDRVIPVAQ